MKAWLKKWLRRLMLRRELGAACADAEYFEGVIRSAHLALEDAVRRRNDARSALFWLDQTSTPDVERVRPIRSRRLYGELQ